MHLADAFIQSDLQCIKVIHFLSVCVCICMYLLKFKIDVFYVNMLNCNLFLYFQHHYSSLQCHMIFRNHNKMPIFLKTFLIIINVENSRAAQYFCGI